MINKIFFSFTIFLFLSGCVTQAPQRETSNTGRTDTPKVEIPKSPLPTIISTSEFDPTKLKNVLGMNRNKKQLGYGEKAFNTCRAGLGFASTSNCQKKYLIVIHFRLLCRESEGTVSKVLNSSDLNAVANQPLKYFLKNYSGTLATDDKGYGQIIFITNESEKLQRLRISNSNDFLLLTAGELKSLIVPANWCS